MLKHGLINVAVTAVKATDDDKGSSFSTICVGVGKPHAATQCKAPLHCPECSNDDRATFVKGQDLGEGRWAILSQDALAGTKASDSEKMELNLTCHPADEVDTRTMAAGRVYYLKEGKGSADQYPLVLELVRQHPEVAFVTVWAVKDVPALYRLGAFGDTLMLTELAWPEKVRPAPTVDLPLNDGLFSMAEQLLEQFTEPFDPTTYRDHRADMIRKLVEAAEQVEGQVLEGAPAAASSAPIDLMAAMAQQLAEAKKAKAKPVRKRAPAKAKKAS